MGPFAKMALERECKRFQIAVHGMVQHRPDAGKQEGKAGIGVDFPKEMPTPVFCRTETRKTPDDRRFALL